MHNYITVSEGRVDIAFNPISNEVGDALQTILPVASVIGWMFAIPENGLKNGLQLTGGVFNHSATIRFTETGQSVHVSQRFSGLDKHNMLHSVLYLSGTVPTISPGAIIEFADHHIEYRKSFTESIQSFSKSSVKAGDQTIPYTVEESITYQECPFSQDATPIKTTRLHISRIISLYEQQERASRFGMDSKLTELGAEEMDVCRSLDCGQHAGCVPQDGQAVCVCSTGYETHNSSAKPLVCTAKPIIRGRFLAFTQGMSVVKLVVNQTSIDRDGQLAILPGQTAVGISVDCVENYLYWSDIAGNIIYRYRYDGSEVEAVLRNINSAEGLAVDFVSRNIFWTDSTNDHIAVAKLTDFKAGKKVIINKNLSNPRTIALHPARGTIYWTDWIRSDPKIESAGMDGSERRVIVNRDLGLPNAIVVDYQTDDLCWADAGNFKVECIGLDGNNRRLIHFGAQYPFGITIHENRIYWTDWTSNNIISVNKNGTDVRSHETLVESSGKVYGITSVPEQCPRLTNACAAGNGGCRFICLPLPTGQRRCACPDSISPDQCDR